MRPFAPPDRPSALASARKLAASVPAALFGFFTVFYAITSAGLLDSADGKVVAEQSRALLQGQLAIPSYVGESVVGVGGLSYSKYGIAQSVLEMPFALLGNILRSVTHINALADWAISFTNTFVTAFGCVLFYLLLRALGASQRRGVVLTLIYGICTLAWPFAKTDFTEPLQTVCLLGATLAVVRWRQGAGMRWLALAGLALAVLILTKSLNVIALPAFALYVIMAILTTNNRISLQPLRERQWWIDALRALSALVALPIVAVAITVGLNAARFGSLTDFGYGGVTNEALFAVPITTGVFGMLFSFNTGVIFYSTPVIMGVFGYKRFVQRRLPESILIATLFVLFLIFYGGFYYWAGQAAFGPRYLVPLVPLLLLPAVDANFGLHGGKVANRWLVAVVCVIIALGFLEEFSGVLVNFETPFALTCVNVPCGPSLDPTQSELLYNIWLAPPTVAYNFLGRTPHLVLSSYPFGAAPGGRADWPALVLDRMRYFWFLPLPHPKVFSVIGAILGAALLLLIGRRLSSFIRELAPTDPAPTETASIAVEASRT